MKTIIYNSYRYGFNGMEKDDEWTSTTGATYDYGFRIYDARIAKFLSVDPLTSSYPMLTPYQFASNTPIWAIDLDGLEALVSTYSQGTNIYGTNDKTQFKIDADKEVKARLTTASYNVNTSQQFINLLETQTKQEGSISYLSVYSHGTANGLIFDNGYDGKEAMAFNGHNWPSYGYLNNSSIDDIVNNENIIFDANALVVFGGCNIGLQKKYKGKNIKNFASVFTKKTGIASIGATDFSQPLSGDENIRSAKKGYFLYINTGRGNVRSIFLGSNLTIDIISLAKDFVETGQKSIPRLPTKKAIIITNN